MVDKIDGADQLVEDELITVDPKTGVKTHPETVPWDQYVGAKKTISTKVDKLVEQLKNTVSKEEHDKVQAALTAAQGELTKAQADLKVFQESSMTEKKKILEDKGVPKEKLDGLTEAELTKINGILADVKLKKPGADLGNGGGGVVLSGSPRELAVQAYASSNRK
jgi:hypothetical protein